MEHEIKTYSALPCELEVFTINGIEADRDDFGYFEIGGDCMEYECGSKFIPESPSDDILAKYGITADEYKTIADELESVLFVRNCGWCS